MNGSVSGIGAGIGWSPGLWEFPLILAGGLLASGHCVGMCGGFAMTLGLSGPRGWRNGARQGAYNLGRVFTYGFLGAFAGFAGGRAARLGEGIGGLSWSGFQAWFGIAAGLALIGIGLRSAGVWSGRIGFRRGRARKAGKDAGLTVLESANREGACLAGSFVGPFLRSDRIGEAFLGGMLTGFLPCGLVYGFLGLAAATGSPLRGAAVMGAFGLGTIPTMMILGVSSWAAPVAWRARMLRAMGWAVVACGMITTTRGAVAWDAARRGEAAACHVPAPATSNPSATPGASGVASK